MQKMPLCEDQHQSKLCYTNVYFTDTQRGSTNSWMHLRKKGLLIYKAATQVGHIELDAKLQY